MSAHSAALLALEKRIRAQIASQVDGIVTKVGAKMAALIRAHDFGTAGELLSNQELHTSLTGALNRAQARVEVVTRTGYLSGARLAKIVAAKELAELGHTAPTSMPDLGGYLDAVIGDVRAAFSNVLFDTHTAVRLAYDGVSGDGAQAARVLTTNAALKRVVGGLSVRLNAAGSAALHRGFTDTQLALYEHYQDINPFIGLRKRWQVTSTNPCPSCRELDGTEIPIDAQFDHDAGTAPGKRSLPVYRDLSGPPRHPNCRCRLILVSRPDTP